MKKLENYRTIIQNLLQDYAQFGDTDDAVEIQLLTDTARDHYQLIRQFDVISCSRKVGHIPSWEGCPEGGVGLFGLA